MTGPAKAPKRVLVVSTLYPNPHRPRFGGFVARSMEALAKHTDWEPVVVNPIGIPPIAWGEYARLKAAARDGIENGVQVHRPTYRLIPKIGARFNPGSIRRAVAPLAARLHREAPFALLDAQFLYPDAPAVAALARELDLPFSAKARGTDVHYWGASGFSKAAIGKALGRADGVLAVSEALARDMRALKLTAEPVTVHYTGLDRDLFRPLPHGGLRSLLAEQFGLAVPDDTPLLLSVGNLVPVKGHDLAIRALSQIPDAHLAILGHGEQRAALGKLARALGLAERVHFVGGVDHAQLPVLLSAADAMVLASEREGLANAWVEAIACGTPVVIPDVGGAREVVSDPVAGRIVARKPAAIARGVAEVLAQDATRQEVAQHAARFDWKVHAEALGAHYDSIAQV